MKKKNKSRFFLLLMIGVSLILLISCEILREFESGSVADIEGNVYKTITIGDQRWMANNLKTTKYNDGSVIPNVEDSTTWINLTTDAYCWYNNNAFYKTTYGTLYNWYAATSNKLCPTGWHVPTDDEWMVLINDLGGESIAGGKLKESGTSHWYSPNTGATNKSGFTALPAGCRYYLAEFIGFGSWGLWWSIPNYVPFLHYQKTNIEFDSSIKHYGLSVRCLKD
jgi:uncharacterized protein (TIGR02145 family)